EPGRKFHQLGRAARQEYRKVGPAPAKKAERTDQSGYTGPRCEPIVSDRHPSGPVREPVPKEPFEIRGPALSARQPQEIRVRPPGARRHATDPGGVEVEELAHAHLRDGNRNDPTRSA